MGRMKLTGSHGYVEGVVEHEKGTVRNAEFVNGNNLYVDYGEGRLDLKSADGFHFTGQYVEKGDPSLPICMRHWCSGV